MHHSIEPIIHLHRQRPDNVVHLKDAREEMPVDHTVHITALLAEDVGMQTPRLDFVFRPAQEDFVSDMSGVKAAVSIV